MSHPPSLGVVRIDKPRRDELVAKIEEFRDRAIEGTLATLFYVAIDEKGNWTVNWAGDPQDRLKSVGCIEALKWELMARAEDAAS